MTARQGAAALDLVRYYATKSGRCVKCGRTTIRAKTFEDFQLAGEKRKDTHRRLGDLAEAWKKEPIAHVKCLDTEKP